MIWNRISNLPALSHYNSAVKVRKEILVTGYCLYGVYKYNPQSDSFSLLFLEGSRISYRTLLKTSKGEVILISEEYGVFKSRKDDLRTWTKISETRINAWNVTNRSEYIEMVSYLDHSNNLNILDINSYEIRRVALSID